MDGHSYVQGMTASGLAVDGCDGWEVRWHATTAATEDDDAPAPSTGMVGSWMASDVSYPWSIPAATQEQSS